MIKRTTCQDLPWIKEKFIERWDSDYIVSVGKIHTPEELEGFIQLTENKKTGLITFLVTGNELEITSLDSFNEHKGIGRALLQEVIQHAKQHNVHRIWLTTTNDNFRAMKFYQKAGLAMVKIHRNSIEKARTIKPSIPLTGNDGIPLRDELEFEMII
jgi:ribosomal protein S18 acetylase RimI-like enzyme